MPKLIDLTGQRFGRLIVLRRAEKNIDHRPAWQCKCDCGNIKIISGKCLRNGQTKSCGCLSKELAAKRRKLNIPIGSKWGHWTVLKEDKQDIYGNFYYLCKCDCGTEKSVIGRNLHNGNSTSCGLCLRNNIIGKKFGLLTIIDINLEKTNNKNLYVNCICDCGNKKSVSYGNLKNGNVKSCGCLGNSYGEYKVKQLLSQNNIPYEYQKTFQTCRFNDTKALAYFDFYVNNKYLIEVDGKQHFYESCQFRNSDNSFKKIREHDLFKNEWCRKNQIPIIRIPFNYIDHLTIKDLLLESSNLILKGDDYYFSQHKTSTNSN